MLCSDNQSKLMIKKWLLTFEQRCTGSHFCLHGVQFSVDRELRDGYRQLSSSWWTFLHGYNIFLTVIRTFFVFMQSNTKLCMSTCSVQSISLTLTLLRTFFLFTRRIKDKKRIKYINIYSSKTHVFIAFIRWPFLILKKFSHSSDCVVTVYL